MKYTINAESDIPTIASEITDNSEMFGDETLSVISNLSGIWNDAQKYGCSFTRAVPDMWGGVVSVVANPTTKRHAWTF